MVRARVPACRREFLRHARELLRSKVEFLQHRSAFARRKYSRGGTNFSSSERVSISSSERRALSDWMRVAGNDAELLRKARELERSALPLYRRVFSFQRVASRDSGPAVSCDEPPSLSNEAAAPTRVL